MHRLRVEDGTVIADGDHTLIQDSRIVVGPPRVEVALIEDAVSRLMATLREGVHPKAALTISSPLAAS